MEAYLRNVDAGGGEKKKIKAIYYALQQHSRLLTGPIFLKNDGFISTSLRLHTKTLVIEIELWST